ncbi:MAG: hypothetical protein FD147_2564 [Chloroflexi bacterium]|nr:MAG: hypothetical protein FD147_2564 [Chloroflexota bacterium]MBA4375821.1 hypothetical protein [Anaerolinea sp.]
MSEQVATCPNPNCKASIGNIVVVEDQELLQIGGLLISKVDGVCIKCGKQFHWWATDRLLEAILERLIKKEEKTIEKS